MASAPRHARSLDDALALGSRHGRRTVREGATAAAAWVDAVSFAVFGVAADQSALEPFWLLAVELGTVIGRDGPDGELSLDALVDALDDEVRRWESRGCGDAAAQGVALALAELRALLEALQSPTPGAPRTGPRPAASTGTAR